MRVFLGVSFWIFLILILAYFLPKAAIALLVFILCILLYELSWWRRNERTKFISAILLVLSETDSVPAQSLRDQANSKIGATLSPLYFFVVMEQLENKNFVMRRWETNFTEARTGVNIRKSDCYHITDQGRRAAGYRPSFGEMFRTIFTKAFPPSEWAR